MCVRDSTKETERQTSCVRDPTKETKSETDIVCEGPYKRDKDRQCVLLTKQHCLL